MTTRIQLTAEVDDDFERILDLLTRHGVVDAAERVHEIISALEVLRDNPLIGRLGDDGLRELVIGRRTRGYVALYQYVPEMETVFVVAVRGQKEAGYHRPED